MLLSYHLRRSKPKAAVNVRLRTVFRVERSIDRIAVIRSVKPRLNDAGATEPTGRGMTEYEIFDICVNGKTALLQKEVCNNDRQAESIAHRMLTEFHSEI